MNDLLKQLGTWFGAGVTGACCLGAPLVLSALSALGLGFLVHDAILIPLLAGFIAWNLWLLYRSTRHHARQAPFWLGLAGGVLAVAGLFVMAPVVAAGLIALLAASVWDFANGRSSRA